MTSSPNASMPAPTRGSAGEAAGPRRRLTRSHHDRWVAGVAGGIAEYLAVDPLLVRLLFVLLAVASGGVALAFYIVAIFVVPGDTMTSDGTRRRNSRTGGLVVGFTLVVVGGIWLLTALGYRPPAWDLLLAAALVVVGGGLVLTAGRSGSGLLIAIGLLLTVILSGLGTVRVPVDRAFGDETQHPTSMALLQREYSHAFGSFTLDLTSIELPEGTTHIRVTNSFGSTRVRLPARAAARVQASTVFGEARVLGLSFAGVGTNRSTETPDFASSPRRIEIELDTAFGSAEVTR